MKRCVVLFILLVISVVLPAGAQEGQEIDAETMTVIRQIEQQVVEMRGLAPVEPVDRALWTRAQVETWLMDILAEVYPPEDARDDAIFYNALDFLPLETDLRQLQVELLTEQVGGFYDDETGQMVVVFFSESFDALAEVIYAHEFTHALQDQHFDLGALGLGAHADPDQTPDLLLARMAVAEGDASQLMAEYTIWRSQQEDGMAFSMAYFSGALNVGMQEFEAAPPIIQAELLFPYLTGQLFVQNVLDRGGWVLLDAVYARPPMSTEQILHPQQYFDADEPQLVALEPVGDVLGEGWRLAFGDTLGEFYLREYLKQYLPRDEAVTAAEGWGGDRLAVYHNDETGQTVWLLRSVWDALSHEREFIDAFHAFAGARYGDTVPSAEEEGMACWEGMAEAPLREDATCLYYADGETLMVQAPNLDMVKALTVLQP